MVAWKEVEAEKGVEKTEREKKREQEREEGQRPAENRQGEGNRVKKGKRENMVTEVILQVWLTNGCCMEPRRIICNPIWTLHKK